MFSQRIHNLVKKSDTNTPNNVFESKCTETQFDKKKKGDS